MLSRLLPGSRHVAFVWLTAAAFMLSTPACRKAASSAEKGAPAEVATLVSLAPVRLGPLDETIKIVGTLYGREEITISAKVEGQIVRMPADIGDRVPPGGMLCEIDPTNYQLAVNEAEMAVSESLSKLGLREIPAEAFKVEQVSTVERARYQVENARARYERGRKLNMQKPPVMSDQEFRDLETAYSVARSDYEVAQLDARAQLAAARTKQMVLNTARQRLADTGVKAPGAESMKLGPRDHFAVSKRYVSINAYVDAGDALFDLILDDPIKYRATVPELYLAKVRAGQAVNVTVESYPGQVFKGSVSRINPAIDRVSRTFEVEVAVSNPERKLHPGAFARGDLIVGRAGNVPFVPSSAIVSFAGIDRVFSVRDGKAAEHIVQAGDAIAGEVPVMSGLNGVDSVVVTNNTALRADAKVVVGKN